ncbi:MAG: hypothetical protein H7Z19_11480 [Chitinophagaceae bacterium]|nr:hypothetical protein [Rubrivivax sp.]
MSMHSRHRARGAGAQLPYLEKQRDWLEKRGLDNSLAAVSENIAKQKEAGIQEIRFSAADTAAYLKQSQNAGWAGILKNSPQHGAKLRQLLVAP